MAHWVAGCAGHATWHVCKERFNLALSSWWTRFLLATTWRFNCQRLQSLRVLGLVHWTCWQMFEEVSTCLNIMSLFFLQERKKLEGHPDYKALLGWPRKQFCLLMPHQKWPMFLLEAHITHIMLLFVLLFLKIFVSWKQKIWYICTMRVFAHLRFFERATLLVERALGQVRADETGMAPKCWRKSM